MDQFQGGANPQISPILPSCKQFKIAKIAICIKKNKQLKTTNFNKNEKHFRFEEKQAIETDCLNQVNFSE